MFQFELAKDPRTHNLLAGVVSMVGLPHYGYNFGPSSPMHFLGFWGINDTIVPPKAGVATDGSFLPNRSSQKSGWFYQTAKSTTAKWAKVLQTDQKHSVNYHETMLGECWQYSNGLGGSEVTGCYYKHKEHTCDERFMRDPIIKYLKSHTKPSTTAKTSLQ